MRKAERRPGHQHCLPGVGGSPASPRSPALKLTEAGKRAAEGSPAKTRPHWDNSPVLEPAIKLNSAFRSPEGEKKVREAVAKAGKDPTARTLSPRPTIHTKTPASPIPAVRTESLGSPASAPAPAAAPAPVPSTPDTSAAPPPAAPAPSPPSAIPKPLPTTSPARPTISAPSVSSTGLSAHRSFDPLANPIIQSILGDMSQLTHSGSASEAVGLLQTISDKARRAALDYADQYRTAGAAASTPGSAGPAPAALAPGFSAGAPRQNTASPTRRQSSPAVAPAPRHPSPPRQPSPPRATVAPSLAINPAARSPAPAPSPSTARPSTPPQVLDFGAAIATPPLNLPPRPQEGRLLTSPGRDGIPQRDHGSYAPSAGAAPAAAASPTYPSIAHLTPPSGRRSPPQTPQRQSPPRSALSPDRLAPYPASSAYDEVTRSRALASAELRDVHAHALAVDRAAAAALSGSPASRDRFVAAEPLRDLPRERDLPLRDPREVGRDSLLLSRSAEPAVPLRDARDLPREYARELPRDLPRDLPSRDPPRGSTYDAAPRYPADRRDASPSVLDKGLRGPETYGRSPESRSLPPAPAPSTGATSALSATLPPNHPLHRYTSGSGSSEPRNA